jgi:hypothetical protein
MGGIFGTSGLPVLLMMGIAAHCSALCVSSPCSFCFFAAFSAGSMSPLLARAYRRPGVIAFWHIRRPYYRRFQKGESEVKSVNLVYCCSTPTLFNW